MAKGKKGKIKWTESILCVHFNLKSVLSKHPLLEEWLDVSNNLTEAEKAQLEEHRAELEANVSFWNEEELKIKFLAFILRMADYDHSTKYRTYLDRDISAIVQGEPLLTKADFMISKGVGDYYTAPYFCFHEFKRKKNADDPIAQVLMAMLISQEKNKNDKPIYGCYIMGANWYFMLIQGDTYAQMTSPLRATNKNELQEILLILRKFKVILETQLQD